VAEETDWDDLRALAQRVLHQGAPLELTDETRALLWRTAQQVAISQGDAEEALSCLPTATALLQEIRRRIRDGSNRLGDAMLEAYRLRDEGNIEEACQQMRDILAVEVVPLYREQAEILLEKLTDLKGR
jgi:DUSAM domain-containing protein